MKISVKTLDNTDAGEIELSDSVFGLPVREDLLHRIVHWPLAKRRAGTHKTTGVSEISGKTKKPSNQTGTGSARQASRRPTEFRGGAVIVGPARGRASGQGRMYKYVSSSVR